MDKTKKIPHWLNNSNINHKNRRDWGKFNTPYYTYTWPLTLLAWYKHFNKTWRCKTCYMGSSLPS